MRDLRLVDLPCLFEIFTLAKFTLWAAGIINCPNLGKSAILTLKMSNLLKLEHCKKKKKNNIIISL